MSENNSKPWPISGSRLDNGDLTVDFDLGFDGAENILRCWRRGIQPELELTEREWAEGMRSAGWRRLGPYMWDQGPGLPGDWIGRLEPSHDSILHFNRASRKRNKTVPSKHAGKTLGGSGLREADGTVHAKTGCGNVIRNHRIPDSVTHIMRHKGGPGAAGSHPAVFPVAFVETVLAEFSDPGDLIYPPFCGSGGLAHGQALDTCILSSFP